MEHKKGAPKKTSKKLMKYYGLNYWNEVAMTEPVALAMAEDLFDWACKNKGKALTLEAFTQERGIPINNLYEWRKKWPCIDNAVKAALPYIGNNRETGALKKRFSEKVVLNTMHHYSARWRKIDSYWEEKRKKEEEEKKITIELKDLVNGRTKDNA